MARPQKFNWISLLLGPTCHFLKLAFCITPSIAQPNKFIAKLQGKTKTGKPWLGQWVISDGPSYTCFWDRMRMYAGTTSVLFKNKDQEFRTLYIQKKMLNGRLVTMPCIADGTGQMIGEMPELSVIAGKFAAKSLENVKKMKKVERNSAKPEIKAVFDASELLLMEPTPKKQEAEELPVAASESVKDAWELLFG